MKKFKDLKSGDTIYKVARANITRCKVLTSDEVPGGLRLLVSVSGVQHIFFLSTSASKRPCSRSNGLFLLFEDAKLQAVHNLQVEINRLEIKRYNLSQRIASIYLEISTTLKFEDNG